MAPHQLAAAQLIAIADYHISAINGGRAELGKQFLS
jgi:hypothetical protein